MSFWEDNERLREDNRSLREDNEALRRERDHLHRQLIGGSDVKVEYGNKQQRIDRTRGAKVEKLESLEDVSRILGDDLATAESDIQVKRSQKHRLEVYVEVRSYMCVYSSTTRRLMAFIIKIPSYKRHRRHVRRASLAKPIAEVSIDQNALMCPTSRPVSLVS